MIAFAPRRCVQWVILATRRLLPTGHHQHRRGKWARRAPGVMTHTLAAREQRHVHVYLNIIERHALAHRARRQALRLPPHAPRPTNELPGIAQPVIATPR